MNRSTRVLTGLLTCAAPLLLGAGKPAPAPTAPFTPALAYKYGSQDIRLANADGSQAVVLVREPRGTQPLWLALAPLSKRQVAYVSGTDGFVRSVRLASWTQDTVGGPLTVSVDPTPLFTTSPAGGANLTGLDYSPDGSQLAVLSTDFEARTELRFFNVATREQIGETIALPHVASTLSWRPSDGAIILRGTLGLSIFKDGVQSAPIGGNQTTGFDTFNGTSLEVMLPYKADVINGPTYRWDGVTVTEGAPGLSKIVDGVGWSISCDNSRMIYTDRAARNASFNLDLATGVKVLFSKDSNVQRMEYPNSCN